MTVVSPRIGKQDRPFATADPFPDADADPLHGAPHVKGLYLKECPASPRLLARGRPSFSCLPPAPRADDPARGAGGGHKAGSITSQQACEAAVAPLFAPPDRCKQMRARKDFLVGGSLTEDVYLFAAIVRFDCLRRPLQVCTIRCGHCAIDL